MPDGWIYHDLVAQEFELETDGTESIVNQYTVVGKIGEGAFGQVCLDLC